MTDQPSSSATYTLLVDGMSCKHCEAAATEAAQSVPGVTEAKVNLKDGRIAVQGREPEAVMQAINDTGYTARMS